jgi:glycyl-tRNA synthetase
MVRGRDDVVGLDSSIILAPQVWEASGHVATFTDPLTECKKCHKRWRADNLIEAYEDKHKKSPANGLADITCTNCGTKGDFTEPRDFNGMLRTTVGPVDDAGAVHYLRPETAQGIFVNHLNVMNASRKTPPFGMGQTGKSFRNEITPGNFIFRTREFEQMEMEFFIHEDDDWAKWHRYWIEWCKDWLKSIGLPDSHLSEYDHLKEKLAFYSKGTTDIMFKFPFGVQELWGIAARGNYDLGQHAAASGKPQEIFDEATKKKFVPHVIEPAVGLDRIFLAVLTAAYAEEQVVDEKGNAEMRGVRLQNFFGGDLGQSRRPRESLLDSLSAEDL